jgi:hypothetical protein
LMAINPVVGKIQDVRNLQFKFGTSPRSFWALVALGLLVAALFAYLYLRDWWLERGFRRYRVGLASGDGSARITPDSTQRKSLFALGASKPVKRSSSNALRDSNGGFHDRLLPALPMARAIPTNGQTGFSNSPKSARGVVLVQAEDPFHEIYVDDVFVGNAPARLNLVDGRHSIEIRKPGFTPFRRELQVMAEAEVSLRAHLEKSLAESCRPDSPPTLAAGERTQWAGRR